MISSRNGRFETHSFDPSHCTHFPDSMRVHLCREYSSTDIEDPLWNSQQLLQYCFQDSLAVAHQQNTRDVRVLPTAQTGSFEISTPPTTWADAYCT